MVWVIQGGKRSSLRIAELDRDLSCDESAIEPIYAFLNDSETFRKLIQCDPGGGLRKMVQIKHVFQ